ncbi:helix-turn-helix transcriptional regulator [Halothermothrix orenii]|uniref:Putative signal-transduction protein with CBS domains n=1 Tax=Halothermothrix orenii (strain H 168 / OCM 544 / DSM 9562) TaxID=373903 RepID=B8CXK2_HALOH|nr:helix-turn-helix transcriptional regulator [Halothermothrix orenii]ACL70021.1 putative signal-transduction protein with CBS domains [Halothermothrix orenii H 168]
MNLSERQKEIIRIVKQNEPITSQDIAERLGLSRAALRSDLAVLTAANLLEAKPRVGYFYIEKKLQIDEVDELVKIPIKDIMSPPVVVAEDVSIYKSIVTMFLEDVGTLFVINENEKLCGVISRKDLLKMSMGQNDLKRTPVSLAMTRMPNIIIATSDDSYLEATRKIVDNQIDSLPVVNEDMEVVGRFSKTNIARNLVDFLCDNMKGKGD